MTTSPQIFKATYSGVPVYEMICKGVAVMRRREDSYLNATQILKVAEFDKPQRTRILEREVQKGEHEKVQGGYGKYQGTWVPFERGIALAQQYHVQEHLQPIIDFVPSDKSPPLAPKHITAASTRPRKPRETRPPGMPKLKKLKTNDSFDANSQISSDIESEEFTDLSGREVSEMELGGEDSDVSMESGSGVSISSNNSVEDSDVASSEVESNPDGTGHGHNRVERRHHRRHHRHHTRKRREEELEHDSSRYAHSLLEYFISDSQQVPKILAHPPDDLDINMYIDEEGHTCLHWAAAMGRMKIVKILINNDADIYRVNNDGQTALMRSVLFTNNSESQTFPHLAELLHKTIFNIDRNDRTVFHHIAATAANKGKVHASRYYMVCLLERLSPHDSETISILNVQDVLGDTALTIAARIANKKLVKVLLDHGADPHIRNKSGKSAQDYIVEAERQAKIRGIPESPLMGSSSSGVQRPHLKVIPIVNKLFEQLSSAYDQDMIAKEHDLRETRVILEGVQSELAEIRRLIAEQQNNNGELERTRAKIHELDRKLKLKLEKRQKAKLRKWIGEEEKKLASKSITEIIKFGDVQLPIDNLASSETQRLPSPPVQVKQESTTNNDSNITPSSYAPSSSSPPEPSSTSTSIPTLEAHAARLRAQLSEMQSLRKSRINEVVSLKGQTAQRQQDYKKLVSMCCNIPLEQVDNLLTPLIEALNSEEGYF